MSNEIKDEPISLRKVLSTALTGMKIAAKQAFEPIVTEQYPKERPKLPWGTKGQLYVEIDECISCFKCSTACPSDCIRIDVARVAPGALPDTKDGHKRMFEVVRFDIDMGKCCYCGMCTSRSTYLPGDKVGDATALALAENVAACPTDCLNFYPRFENGSPDPENMVYHFAEYDYDGLLERWKGVGAKERRSTHQTAADLEYGTVPPPAPPKPAVAKPAAPAAGAAPAAAAKPAAPAAAPAASATAKPAEAPKAEAQPAAPVAPKAEAPKPDAKPEEKK